MQRKNYELRLYDEPLLGFAIASESTPLGPTERVEKIRPLSPNKHLLPITLLGDSGPETVRSWLGTRSIPANRAFVDSILRSAGINNSFPSSFLDISKGLSLNDSFWVVPEGFEGKFAEFNLYENRFDKILSLVAYTGVYASKPLFSTSPELTTGGMLAKAWRRRKDGHIYLYKAGSTGARNAGLEPYSEFYVSKLAQYMGLDAVDYDLRRWKGILASVCELFTNIDTAYVPAGHIVRSGGIKACVDYYDSLGESFGQAIRNMLVFDALVCQEDRHFGNFGLLRDNKTGRFSSPAPLFDNGIALLNYALDEDISTDEKLDNYVLTRSTPYGMSYAEVCFKYMTRDMHERLRKILSYSLPCHAKYNLPQPRLDFLERFIRRRAGQLLNIPPVPLFKKQDRQPPTGDCLSCPDR